MIKSEIEWSWILLSYLWMLCDSPTCRHVFQATVSLERKYELDINSHNVLKAWLLPQIMYDPEMAPWMWSCESGAMVPSRPNRSAMGNTQNQGMLEQKGNRVSTEPSTFILLMSELISRRSDTSMPSLRAEKRFTSVSGLWVQCKYCYTKDTMWCLRWYWNYSTAALKKKKWGE